MKTLSKIFTVILITAMIPIGVPLHTQEDVSLNGIVDLNDAILLVQDISGQGENQRIFSANFKNLISALKNVADLQSCQEGTNTLQPGSHKTKSTIKTDVTALLPSTLTEPFLPPVLTNLFDYHKFYQSFSTSPPTPPPKITIS